MNIIQGVAATTLILILGSTSVSSDEIQHSGEEHNVSSSDKNDSDGGTKRFQHLKLISHYLNTLKKKAEDSYRPDESHRRRVFYKPNNRNTNLLRLGTLPSQSEQKIPQNLHNETYICSKPYWNMEFHKKLILSSDNFGKDEKTYKARTNCTVIYQGSRSCTPVINCGVPISLRGRVDGSCKKDYLHILDGLGGGVKYCQNDKIRKLKPSNYGKDFYIQWVTGPTAPDYSFTGFNCTVSCKPKKTHDRDQISFRYVEPEPIVLKPSKTEKKYLSNCVCGLQTKNDGSHRIVGGTDAKEFEFPWLVAIVLKFTRQPVCGGAIINDRHILTAAHCFVLAQLNASDVEVLVHAHLLDATISGDIANVPLGEKGSIQGIGWDLEQKSDKDENSTRFGVDEVFVHPMFTEGYQNDVAIMKLSKKLDLTTEAGATPICLPKPSPERDLYIGKLALVAGWGMGHEDASASNRILQKLEDIPIVDHEQCSKLMKEANETLGEKMMCAGFLEGGKDSCTGDSGGPLILKQPSGQFMQIGIVSWGSGCAKKDSPGVYTDLQGNF